jgi:hypothetical protein
MSDRRYERTFLHSGTAEIVGDYVAWMALGLGIRAVTLAR